MKLLSLVVVLLAAVCSTYAQLKLNNNGYVMVGSNNVPLAPLQVNGNLRIENVSGPVNGLSVENYMGAVIIDPLIDNNGELGHFRKWSVARVSVVYYSYLLQLPSDERMKENIKDLAGAVSTIKKIRPVQYNIKPLFFDQGNNPLSSTKMQLTNQMGLLAQELQTVLPGSVVYDSISKSYGVNYVSLIPLVIQALKEQQKMIEDLQGRLSKNNLKIGSMVTDDANAIASLEQNFPNPFSQSTKIGYYLPGAVTNAVLYIYNMNGNQVKSIPVSQSGSGSITINGYELQPGMYFYTLIADGKEIDTKRMILTD